ncbi:MAG: UDP-N-acetylglucosamine--N-acetylmuramyl-(pentapeptide) pyrophosphoryl-undecaprenol N-acetylglucosamine transferase [Planctomycetes bacterium]|nr:UDP-N-acetylglucosamine--N-acetylmuramyl-(pentapeptide) pyrophosphoryl-undecaprenol N-acetylglucosamine transferase [Planctomycetota bacterium]
MNNRPWVAFAGGGSGGHLYPALAVAGELADLLPGVRFVFFSTDRAIDGNVLGAYDGQWVRQSVKPMPRRVWQWPQFAASYWDAVQVCRRFFVKHRPLVVLGSGGYASAPSIWEAARERIPTALMNPDALPGKANRFLGSRVQAIFTQWDETAERFNGRARVHVTGCPVRPEFKRTRREDGLAHFGLDPQKKVLLVTGASQGAQSINRAMLAVVPRLAADGVWDQWQVLHLTGRDQHDSVAAAYRDQPVTVRVVGYTQHMASAVAAADLVLARAGASTLAEITAVGRPSVLMPYPFHRDQHQVANARVLVKLGAARMLADRVDPQANAPALAATLGRVMTDDAELSRLRTAARRVGTTRAAAQIARHLIELAGRTTSTAESNEWRDRVAQDDKGNWAPGRGAQPADVSSI